MNDAHLSRIIDDLGDQFQRRFEVNNVQNLLNDDNVVLNNSSYSRNVKNELIPLYRRPSLQSRLQDGKNLQLCFLNEQTSEVEDNQFGDGAFSLPVFRSKYLLSDSDCETQEVPVAVAVPLSSDSDVNNERTKHDTNNNAHRNFYDLQNEVCLSLKKIYADANKRMEFNDKRRSDSPISCTIKTSLKKVGVSNGDNINGRRRVSRQMLTKMNSYQLQTIIDDLHAHVEFLNEQLMKMLMERDELHMSRDSLLVDIEDITAYLNAKHGCQESNFTKPDIADENRSDSYSFHDSAVSMIYAKKTVLPGSRYNRLPTYI